MQNTDHLFFGLNFDPGSSEPINFIEDAFTYLSPFSAHRVEVFGEIFPTAEHAYQAARIKPGRERDAIKEAPSPKDAWRCAQTYKNNPEYAVENFDKDATIEEIFRAKLAQHADVAAVLKATGRRELLKVYDTDYYWGTGADGTGENRMGKIWMKIRDELA